MPRQKRPQLADHLWVDQFGLPWTLESLSDLCAACGVTPDAHPVQLVLTPEQVDLIRERMPQRLDWARKGYPTDDFYPMVAALVDHARYTSARPLRGNRSTPTTE